MTGGRCQENGALSRPMLSYGYRFETATRQSFERRCTTSNQMPSAPKPAPTVLAAIDTGTIAAPDSCGTAWGGREHDARFLVRRDNLVVY